MLKIQILQVHVEGYILQGKRNIFFYPQGKPGKALLKKVGMNHSSLVKATEHYKNNKWRMSSMFGNGKINNSAPFGDCRYLCVGRTSVELPHSK